MAFDPVEMGTFEVRILERVRYRMRQELSRQKMGELHSDALIDHLTGNMILCLEREVWTERASTVIRFPRDWWQAVKCRWFPKSWLRRWPVIEETVTIEANRLYPNMKVAGQDAVLRIAEHRGFAPAPARWTK